MWRVVQGVGGALIFANAGALVTDVFPRERLGLAMGTNVMVAAVGLVIGPVLGGWLVTYGWQWVFWFNVPLGLIGTVWAWLILHETVRRDVQQQLDWAGNILMLVGLTGLVLALSDAGLDGWSAPMVIIGMTLGVICLPIFVWVESRVPAPMLDLSLFRIRVYSAAAAAAFLNGLARFALMFLFVFYFQGPQQQDPITAGLMLAPLAIGMLIASPLAGAWADRHGSRTPAVLGMLLTAAGLAGMTTLQVDSPYWMSAIWLSIAGIGSGVFNSPNTSAMMAAVPPWRRGIASGTRVMLQNTGAVISIALMLMIVTATVPTLLLFSIFSGLTTGLSAARLAPFMSGMHLALWILCGFSLLGAAVSAMRGSVTVPTEQVVACRRAEPGHPRRRGRAPGRIGRVRAPRTGPGRGWGLVRCAREAPRLGSECHPRGGRWRPRGGDRHPGQRDRGGPAAERRPHQSACGGTADGRARFGGKPGQRPRGRPARPGDVPLRALHDLVPTDRGGDRRGA